MDTVAPFPLPQNLTPEALSQNPRLLTHKATDSDICSFDGLVGALVDDGRFIVTSPNESRIYLPPLGGDRSVYLRDDLRFGDDDPLQWPQPFVEKLPHFACIRRKPVTEDTGLEILWLVPTGRDMTMDKDGILFGVGKVNFDIFYRLNRIAQAFIDRVSNSPFRNEDILSQLCKALRHILDRLQHLSTGLRNMQIGVRETQRMILELEGALDYFEVYRPRMEGSFQRPKRVAHRMGAFTTNLGVAEQLFRANLPVWLIRPFQELPSIRIQKVVPVYSPDGLVSLLRATRPTHNSIFRGSATDFRKYVAIGYHVLRYFTFSDPFGSKRVVLESSAPPLIERTPREVRRQRYSPYANQKQKASNTSAAGRDKFLDPTSPIYPPAIPAWRAALEGVKRNGPQHPPADSGYVFPEPASFVALQSVDRRKSFFFSWLKYRAALIFRITIGKDISVKPASAWRMLLSLDYLGKDKEGSSSKETRSGKLQDAVREFLSECLEVDGVGLAANNPDATTAPPTVAWNGKAFEILGDSEFEEILWELSELNFRFELLALDARMTSPPPLDVTDRQELIAACFPKCVTGGSLLIANLEYANQGLSSENWEERALYLHALKRVMMTWRGKPALIDVEKVRWSDQEISELEDVVCQFYTQSFYNEFGRAAIIPRRLSHAASSVTFTDPGPITIQNPRPNTFYDTSVLLPL